jgi:hypothetical protein
MTIKWSKRQRGYRADVRLAERMLERLTGDKLSPRQRLNIRKKARRRQSPGVVLGQGEYEKRF